MCYMRRKIEGGVVALRESDDTNFLKPNGQSRNLNIYAYVTYTRNSIKFDPISLHWSNSNAGKMDQTWSNAQQLFVYKPVQASPLSMLQITSSE